MVDRQAVGRKSRGKGQRGERILVKKFGEWWGSEFFRTPGSGSFATRGFSRKAMDVAGDIVTLDESFPFCVESKNVEGWTLDHLLNDKQGHFSSWWEQAVDQCPDARIPLLVFTRNRQPIYFMLPEYLSSMFPDSLSINTTVNDLGVVIGKLDSLLAQEPTKWMKIAQPASP